LYNKTRLKRYPLRYGLRVPISNIDCSNEFHASLKRCVEIAKQFLPLFQGNYNGMKLYVSVIVQ